MRGFYKGVSFVVLGAGPAHALYYGIYESSKQLNALGTKYDAAFSAGSAIFATLAHDLIMVPTDAIKQRYQLADCPFKSIKSCARCMVSQEGFKSLFRSFPVQVTMNIPFHCANFSIYDATNKYLNKEGGYDPVAHSISGALAGTAGVLATNPMDVCKTLLNTQKLNAKNCRVENVKTAIKLIYKTNGFKGFFTGSLLRVYYTAPGTMACWSVYEFFKYVLRDGKQQII